MGSREKKLKVVVGLSGGVDSAVSAWLLQQQGYEVSAVFLECWNEPGCRTDQDRKDALSVALHLGIPFEVLDFRKEYMAKVHEYFVSEYKAGRTPNPDTVCNREIKFGVFYEWALGPCDDAQDKQAQGKQARFDAIATGHYARVVEAREFSNSNFQFSNKFQLPNTNDQDFFLQRGSDQKKDQTYFLYQLRPEQLGKILFPIGGMSKMEVREKARELELPVWDKPDSVGVCFMGGLEVDKFLKDKIKARKGEVVWRLKKTQVDKIKDQKSNIKITDQNANLLGQGFLAVGKHDGVMFKTVGQRLGKEIDQSLVAKLCKSGVLSLDPTNLPAMFVFEKDVEKNLLVVGVEKDLERESFQVREVNMLVGEDEFEEQVRDCWVRIRHGGELVRASVAAECDGCFMVELEKSVKGVAESQACVFYSEAGTDAIVLGGGVIHS